MRYFYADLPDLSDCQTSHLNFWRQKCLEDSYLSSSRLFGKTKTETDIGAIRRLLSTNINNWNDKKTASPNKKQRRHTWVFEISEEQFHSSRPKEEESLQVDIFQQVAESLAVTRSRTIIEKNDKVLAALENRLRLEADIVGAIQRGATSAKVAEVLGRLPLLPSSSLQTIQLAKGEGAVEEDLLSDEDLSYLKDRILTDGRLDRTKYTGPSMIAPPAGFS